LQRKAIFDFREKDATCGRTRLWNKAAALRLSPDDALRFMMR
jgi:hypothetical protein